MIITWMTLNAAQTMETKAAQSDVADLALAIDHFKLADTRCPLLVISADTIFHQVGQCPGCTCVESSCISCVLMLAYDDTLPTLASTITCASSVLKALSPSY